MDEIDASRAGLVAAAMGHEGDLVASRLARGCRCFGVFVQGALAGYGWLSTGPEWIGELQLEIRPRPGEGYVWNCVTLPEHRRRGVFRSLLLGISAAAGAEGLKRLWIGSVAIPAEKAVGPSGFRPALRFASTALAGIHLLHVAAAADPSVGRDAMLVLGVEAGWRLRRSRPRRH